MGSPLSRSSSCIRRPLLHSLMNKDKGQYPRCRPDTDPALPNDFSLLFIRQRLKQHDELEGQVAPPGRGRPMGRPTPACPCCTHGSARPGLLPNRNLKYVLQLNTVHASHHEILTITRY